jgi:hypothetical protein
MRTRAMTVPAVGGTIVVAFLLMSCAGQTRGSGPRFPAVQDEWVLAYGNDFSKEGLDPQWLAAAGDVVVTKGVLALRSGAGFGQVLLKDPCFVSPSVRMEFDAYVADYAQPGDLTAFLNGNESGWEGSYLFQLGTEGNSVSQLRRSGKVVPETATSTVLLEHQHMYHVVVENDRGHIRFVVDGATVFEWEDESPLWGPGHCHVGFYTQESGIHIEYLKVYHKVPKV